LISQSIQQTLLVVYDAAPGDDMAPCLFQWGLSRHVALSALQAGAQLALSPQRLWSRLGR
jgi:hypothetical protein